jgi:hypothetical protein
MRTIFLFLAALLVSVDVPAQFSDSVHHQVAVSATGNINSTNDATSSLLSNTLRYSLRKKTVRLNFNNSWVYGQQGEKLTNNDYNATLDFNLYKTLPHFYYWGLGSYATSFSLKIEHQAQAGVGAAYNIIDHEEGQLNISDGILYERSSILVNDTVQEDHRTFRNSFRLQFRYQYAGRITFSGNGFLQHSFSDSHDYLIRANVGLALKVYKWISLTAAVAYNRAQRTNRENLLFTYGLTAERFF